jgi:hypothetical protein
MLRVGDTILQINGRKVGNLTHHGVERLISQAHNSLKIVAQRNNPTLMRQRSGPGPGAAAGSFQFLCGFSGIKIYYRIIKFIIYLSYLKTMKSMTILTGS